MDDARQCIVDEARSWIGTPYRHRALVKGAKGGCDCMTFLIGVYSNVGLLDASEVMDRIKYYPVDWFLHRDEERYLNEIENYTEKTDDPRPGDVALFQFGRAVSHSAVLIEKTSQGWKFVHSWMHDRRVAEGLESDYWRARFRGFWKVKGL